MDKTLDLQQNHNELRLKAVGLDHLEQYNKLLRYVFQVTNADIFSSGYRDGELVQDKMPVLERSDVIAWFDGDDIVSQLSVYPCRVNIHGRIFKMGGLTGVGTYPEYSNLGLMSRLIRIALERMRAAGQWISCLYPYSVPYYKRKGWEIMNDLRTYTVRDDQLPSFEVPGYVQRLTVNDPDVKSLYDAYANQRHGALLRGPSEWAEYWRWENEEERIAAVYYTADDRPTGLMFYWVNDDIFHIKDLIYLNNEAREGLWNFIGAHRSMVDKVRGRCFSGEAQIFFLEDSQITEIVEPYYMARIVDATQFLRHYPFAEAGEPLHFILSDSEAEWNNGVFSLNWPSGNQAKVGEQTEGPAVELDIRALTVMLLGYRRPTQLAELGRLHAGPEALRILERVIPRSIPYFSDYF